MIRVIVERQLKSGEDIGRLLFDLHMIAVQQKGHISNETWINTGNSRSVAVFSTWETLDDWKAWESSMERARIINKINPLLTQEAQIQTYEIISPMDAGFYADPVGWTQEHERPHFEG